MGTNVSAYAKRIDTNVSTESRLRYVPTTKTTGWLSVRVTPIPAQPSRRDAK